MGFFIFYFAVNDYSAGGVIVVGENGLGDQGSNLNEAVGISLCTNAYLGKHESISFPSYGSIGLAFFCLFVCFCFVFFFK